MNYPAPTKQALPKNKKRKSRQEIISILWESFQSLYEFVTGIVEKILNCFGIEMPNIMSLSQVLCSACICCGILGMTGSMSIAVGIGLGVGLNCGKTVYISSVSNTSRTFIANLSNGTG